MMFSAGTAWGVEWKELLQTQVEGGVTHMCINPSADRLIIARRIENGKTATGRLSTLEIKKESRPVAVVDLESDVTSQSLSEDGSMLAVSTTEGSIRLFKTADWEEVPLWKSLTVAQAVSRPVSFRSKVSAVALSKTARYLCFVTSAGQLGLIDVAQKELSFYESRKDRDNCSIAISPGSDDRFWVGTQHGMVRQLSCQELQVKDIRAVFDAPVWALADSGQGRIVASNLDRQMAAIDRDGVLTVFPVPQFMAMHFVASDKYVACAEGNQKLSVWDVANKSEVRSLPLHTLGLSCCLAVSRKEGVIAAATDFGDIVVMKIAK